MPPRKSNRGDDRRHDVAATILPPDLEAERALDTRQTAALTGHAEITLAQWRALGKGPPFFRCGRSIRYRLGDVLAWRDERSAGRASR